MTADQALVQKFNRIRLLERQAGKRPKTDEQKAAKAEAEKLRAEMRTDFDQLET